MSDLENQEDVDEGTICCCKVNTIDRFNKKMIHIIPCLILVAVAEWIGIGIYHIV